MGELLLANVEAVVLGLLEESLSVAVGTSVPNPRPGSFVRVQRIGGGQVNMIQERPSVLVECWAPTRLAAWNLAAEAHSSLVGRNSLEYNGVELEDRALSSPVNYPDPSTASPRYQFTVQATVTMERTTS